MGNKLMSLGSIEVQEEHIASFNLWQEPSFLHQVEALQSLIRLVEFTISRDESIKEAGAGDVETLPGTSQFIENGVWVGGGGENEGVEEVVD